MDIESRPYSSGCGKAASLDLAQFKERRPRSSAMLPDALPVFPVGDKSKNARKLPSFGAANLNQMNVDSSLICEWADDQFLWSSAEFCAASRVGVLAGRSMRVAEKIQVIAVPENLEETPAFAARCPVASTTEPTNDQTPARAARQSKPKGHR
jgi:hypothetical protein